jgi:LysR family cys regulon transcriptional activator
MRGGVVDEEGRYHVAERGTVRLTAIDADVIKTYVEIGMEIAVLATIAFDRRRDRGLAAVRADHLFRPGIVNLVIRKYGYLSRNAREFISLFALHIRLCSDTKRQ